MFSKSQNWLPFKSKYNSFDDETNNKNPNDIKKKLNRLYP